MGYQWISSRKISNSSGDPMWSSQQYWALNVVKQAFWSSSAIEITGFLPPKGMILSLIMQFSLQVTHCKSRGLAGVETSVLKFYEMGHAFLQHINRLLASLLYLSDISKTIQQWGDMVHLPADKICKSHWVILDTVEPQTIPTNAPSIGRFRAKNIQTCTG